MLEDFYNLFFTLKWLSIKKNIYIYCILIPLKMGAIIYATGGLPSGPMDVAFYSFLQL